MVGMFMLLCGLLVQQPSQPPTPTPTPAAIRLPVIVPDQPDAPPKPVEPPSTAPMKLPTDVFYVVQSEQPFLVFSSPDGLVKVSKESGPIKIRGKFAEDQKRISTRTFNAKYIAIVEAIEGKSGLCELIIPLVGETDETKALRPKLDIGQLPNPPNPPEPPPQPPQPPPQPPVPPPSPAPIPDEGFRVLMVVEEADASKLPAQQQMIFTSEEVVKYLNTHCAQGPKNKEWRIWDQHVNTANERPVWQKAMQRPRTSLPWIIISNGKTGYEGPLPASIKDTLTLLQKFGG